jgi:CRP/FNR family transcriptional regulator
MTEEITQQLYAVFEKELADEMLRDGELRTVSDGEIIMDYGKKIRFLPIILSGTLKVMKQDENGREILLYYLGTTESCAMAYACCMESKTSEIRVVAEEESELLAIPHQKLDEWLIKYPGWRSYIFSSFTMRFNELLKSLESVAFHKLDERLVSYLKNKSRVAGKSTLPLSHQQIAEELGTSRVVVSRLLKQLENEGKILLYRNEIKLLSGF